MERIKRRICELLACAFCICVAVMLNSSVVNAQDENKYTDEMVYGADIGFLSQLESQGVQWVDD